ncbi:MAG: DUF4838 domain-containing protein [Clostridia bacterium]|nr:DUF4838 domain-containing protein [Clostridia bacterium]
MKRIVWISFLIAAAAFMLLYSCNNTLDESTTTTEIPHNTFASSIRLADEEGSAYVIVRSKDAAPAEIKAAKELRSYIVKICGAKLEIVTDDVPESEYEIIVGQTTREPQGMFDRSDLGEDGFIIQTDETDLYLIGGGVRGTLYAVYEFLEKYLGCRFYTADIEHIPNLSNIVIEQDIYDKQIPAFQYRCAAWYDYFSEDIAAKRRLNIEAWSFSLTDEYGGTVHYANKIKGHSFLYLVPPAEYFEDHPEYFMMDPNGERITDQLCLTNPDVLTITIERAKEWLKADPEADIISISQNDGHHICLCDECKAVYEEEGGVYSGTMVRFVNAVADALSEEYPDVFIQTYAYQATQAAPKTKPLDNVIIQLCPISACSSHSHIDGCITAGIVSHTDGSRNIFIDDLRVWASICDNVYIYDYSTHFGNYVMTLPNFDQMLVNYRTYADNHVVGNVSQGNYESPSAEFGELRAYLQSKLMWNPYITRDEFDAMLMDFLIGVYGPGGTYIYEYLQIAEDQTNGYCFMLYNDNTHIYPISLIPTERDFCPDDIDAQTLINDPSSVEWVNYAEWFYRNSNELVDRGYELFQMAYEMAETAEQRSQIEKIRLQVDYLNSFCLYDTYFSAINKNIEKIVNGVFDRENLYVTEDDRNNYCENAIKIAKNQLRSVYADYNQTLYKKMLREGVTHIREARHLTMCNGNFDKKPWFWENDQ